MARRGRLSRQGLQRGWSRAALEAAATYATALVRSFARRPSSESEAGIPVDAAERRARLTRLGAQVAARAGAARVRTVGSSDERRREVVQRVALRSAEDVLDVLGDMKGAVMKVAQMASFAIDGLPHGVQQRLATLQTAAPPMAPELVEQVVSGELGALDGLFSSFDLEPLAAASIGQVHRARTRDGRDVAVKVQYPGVDEAILADLANADLLFGTLAAMFGGFDPRALLEEVVARMSEEFDYRREAANQRWFAQRYSGHPFVKIPAVVDELSGVRVLTSELVRGRGFYDVLADPQPDRDRYGEIIYRFAFGSIYGDGMFSGDPHPGNYLFLDDGRICFLDFGLVKRMEPDEHEALCDAWRSMLDGRREALLENLSRLGAVADRSLTPDELWSFTAGGSGAVLRDARFRFTRRWVGDELRRTFMPSGPAAEVQMKLQYPPSMAIFNRYAFGTWAVLGHLQAEANWHRIVRELLRGGAASTEIGRRWGPVRGDVRPPPPVEPATIAPSRQRREALSPFGPEAAADPYPAYARLRDAGRVVWITPGIWTLTRYEDAVVVLRDHQRFGSDPTTSELYRVMSVLWGLDSELMRAMNRFMLFSDAPQHTRLRSLVQPAFTRHAVEGLRSRMGRIVDDLLAATRDAGRMDVVADLAYPLPVTVICELLGVPVSDRHRFREWSRALTGLLGAVPSPDLVSRGEEAAAAFTDYLSALISERRRTPRDDLLDELIRAQHEGDGLTEEELLAMALLLLIAGHETTMNLIGNGTLALLRHPGELERLRGDPGLVKSAVEELLRFDSPVQATARTALDDVEVAGVRIQARSRVMVLLGSANRDPAAFTDPDRLDLGRRDNRHVAFGAGPHFCLGAPLARLEAQAALDALVRLPSLELAADGVRWRESFVLRGPLELPVSFG